MILYSALNNENMNISKKVIDYVQLSSWSTHLTGFCFLYVVTWLMVEEEQLLVAVRAACCYPSIQIGVDLN